MRKIKVDNEIVLKAISLATSRTIFNSIHSSRNHLRKWLPFVDQTRSVSDTRNFIKSILNSNCLKKDLLFEIWHLEEFAGLIALKEIDYANLKLEIGYWLDEQKTGKGIMRRACHSIIIYSFNELKMNRISIKVAIGNEKSVAIPIAFDFYQEGIERKGELINNRFNDLLVFSMLKKDWNH